MATVSDESSNNKINIVTNVENNVTVTQPNIQTVTVKAQGPQGPAGPTGAQGPAGDGDLSGLNAFTGSAQASIDALNAFTESGTFTTISASLVTATTGSFTHLKGNSPITIQDSVTFQQPVTGSIFSGSFVGDGTNITGVTATLPSGILSGSDQIASNISGSFTAPSSSFSTRVTSLESGGVSITPGTVSSSLQITQLGFVTSSATASFVTNSQTGSFITTLPNGLLSGSSQIATEISGAFASPFTSAGISGSFNISSASFSTRITSLEGGGGSGFTSAGISGSLGVNAALIRSLTAVNISGSFTAPSSSFSARVTTLENNPSVTPGTLSGSAQIATEISGAFGATSSSLASRTTTLEANPVFSASSISGSSNALSASFSTRVTSNETDITLLTASTGSYLTSLPSGLYSSSLQTLGNITSSGTLSTTGNISGNTINGQIINSRTHNVGFWNGTSISLGYENNTPILIGKSANPTTFVGHITASNNISSSGTIVASNLSGTNTGDQNLAPYALITAISGAFGAPSSSLATRITTNTSNISSNLTKINSLTSATASLVAETLSIFRQEGSPAPGTGATQSIAVTVADVNGANKYLLAGAVTASVVMNLGDAYKFDQSDGTNDGHPFRFSTDEGGSSNYSTNVTVAGTPGNAGAYTLISITAATTAPLYYYCSVHSGMGTGILSINSGSLISTGFVNITGSLTVSGSSTFIGDQSTTGHITASGNISSSGNILAENVFLPGNGKISFDNSQNGSDQFISGVDNQIVIDGDDLIVFKADTSGYEFRDTSNAATVHITTAGAITASGIISASNLTGTNTGDQDLSSYALITAVSGAFGTPSSSFSTRVTTLENAGGGGTPTFIASGSTSASADPGTGIVVNHSGSTAFSVIGDVGTLFSVDDDLTGTLFSVNDISGIPQLEVSASGKVEVGKGPLIANTFETGSITNGSPSSPLQMTLPSGSSKQLFGVGGYHRASWDDGAADHIWFQDDNIRLSYDLSGVDIEGTITKDPKVGEIHIITIKDGTYSALDKQVSDGIFDLNGSFGSDNTDTYTFAAPKDPTWPYYRVTVSSTGAAHDSYFYAIIEKFI